MWPRVAATARYATAGRGNLARRGALPSMQLANHQKPLALVGCAAPLRRYALSSRVAAGRADPPGRYVIAALVQNEHGVLAAVSNLFAGRGYNIDRCSADPVAWAVHYGK